MGEVYRARDTRLARDVAIKVLGPHIAADRDAVLRFEREARALASLNHPHIAAIYDVVDDGTQPALVLELVEGDTVADRIARSPLSVNEAIACATQIADALDAAHEAGIVHRDLKPGNIKFNEDGRVKVLDFGLAKAVAVAAGVLPDLDSANSPTITVHGTKHGVILGTAAYMSPEQSRGKRVDKRTDIWAFGCVVFEMLTGKRAFDGETTSDVIAAILERAPDLSALPRSTPPHIRRVIERCLEKDPKRRARDIADVRHDLDREEQLGGAGQRPLLPWAIAAVASIAAAVIGATNWPMARRGNATSSLVATVLADPGRDGALSPDGRTFAYLDDRDDDIWVRQAAGGAPLRVTTDRARKDALAFSPGGETIYYSRLGPGGRSLWRVATLGGGERKILDAGDRPAPGPDGKQLAFVRPKGPFGVLMVSDIDGSNPRELAANLAAAVLAGPAWSRDSRYLSFVRGQLFTPSNLYVLDMSTRAERQVTHFERAGEGVHGHAWLPDGRHVIATYDRGNDISQSRFDLALIDITDGSIQPLLPAIGDGFNLPTVSADGKRVVVTRTRLSRDLWKVPIGPDPVANGAAAQQIRDGSGDPMWSSVSPDRQLVLFSASSVGVRNLWTMSLDRSSETKQVTTIPDAAVTHSSFAPDGHRIVFASSYRGASDIWIQDLDGSNLRQLTADADADSWPAFSPEGDRVIYSASRNDARETRVVRVDGGTPEKLFDGFARSHWVSGPRGESWCVLTDGTDLVRLIDMTTRNEVWQLRLSGAIGLAMFSPDRRSISVNATEGIDRSVIYVIDAVTRQVRVAARLPFRATFRADWIDDGKSFLVNRELRSSDIVMLDQLIEPR